MVQGRFIALKSGSRDLFQLTEPPVRYVSEMFLQSHTVSPRHQTTFL
jgi:hypothetical protein